jgi:hypothetical protein
VDSDRDGNTHAHSNACAVASEYGGCNGDGHAHRIGGVDLDAYSYDDCWRDDDPHRDAQWHGDAIGNEQRDSYRHVSADGNLDSYLERNGYASRYTHGDEHIDHRGYTDIVKYRHGNSYADVDCNPNSNAHIDLVRDRDSNNHGDVDEHPDTQRDEDAVQYAHANRYADVDE